MAYLKLALYGGIAAFLVGIGFAGAWAWQGEKLANLKLVYEKDLVAADTRADKATKEAQDAANTIETTLTKQLADQHSAYEGRLAAARAALRKLPSCPVPVADLPGLYADANRFKLSNTAASAATDNDSRTVEAGAIIASCEDNRQTFDRNAAKLDACIAFYNQVRKDFQATQK